jgi:IS4 transposase
MSKAFLDMFRGNIMMMDEVMARFAERAPVPVMARLAVQRALDQNWIDTVFEQYRQSQYTRELLFSTIIEIMSVVAMGLRPSLHAAAKAYVNLPVSVTALYDKINHADLGVIRALIQGSQDRLSPVLDAMQSTPAATVEGYRLRIVDGSHLPASEKRLKPLRQFRGAALPGHSLVVYDPDSGLVIDLLPCEDAHAQERACMAPILERAQPGELWIADRNFSTRSILVGWHRRGTAFIVREHGRTPNPTDCDAPHVCGRVDTGLVSEQPVSIGTKEEGQLLLRRIEVQLDRPTDDGDTVIRLLSNLPASTFSAESIASLYRRRWRIENMFQRLESALNSEMATLGYPRAALLAFGVAVLAHNVLAVIERAIMIRHQLEYGGEIELSAFYLALEVKAAYEGMMIAIPSNDWRAYENLDACQLAALLLQLAARADPKRLRKHKRGPKVPKKPGYVSGAEARKRVSTARVLKDGRIV